MLNSHIKILEEKRKQWRQDHPLGFVARPIQQDNGDLNIFEWLCEIPGPRNSIWSKGRYFLELKFPRNSQQRMNISFVPAIFHPNVDSNGRLSSPVTSNWLELSIEQILLIVQSLLENPNLNAPENSLAAQFYQDDNFEYGRRVCMDIEKNHSSNTNTGDEDFINPGHGYFLACS